MEMTTAKTVAVFVIIFGCFAVLYPKIFHPMLMHALGFGGKRESVHDNVQLPPHLQAGGGGKPHMDDSHRHMKSGSPHAHPGMRAAAELRKQANAQQGGSSGKGMMSVVLPMYAVGIVLYLVYTLSKVFGSKKDNKMDSDNFLTPKDNPFQQEFESRKQAEQYSASSARVANASPEETQPQTAQKSRNRELEALLLKADEKDLTDNEMFSLKKRLLETEEQMTRILQAMESMQRGVQKMENEGLLIGSDVPEDANGADEESQDPIEVQPEELKDKTTDLSPDMESYDIVSSQANASDSVTTPDSEEYEDLKHDADNLCDEKHDGQDQMVETLRTTSSEDVMQDDGDAGDDDDESQHEVTEVMMDKPADSDDDEGEKGTHPDLRKRKH